MKEVRKALLDADVNYKVAKQFTDTVKEVFADLAKQVDQAVAQLQTILDNGIKEFNKVVAESKLPVIVIAEK